MKDYRFAKTDVLRMILMMMEIRKSGRSRRETRKARNGAAGVVKGEG